MLAKQAAKPKLCRQRHAANHANFELSIFQRTQHLSDPAPGERFGDVMRACVSERLKVIALMEDGRNTNDFSLNNLPYAASPQQKTGFNMRRSDMLHAQGDMSPVIGDQPYDRKRSGAFTPCSVSHRWVDSAPLAAVVGPNEQTSVCISSLHPRGVKKSPMKNESVRQGNENLSIA